MKCTQKNTRIATCTSIIWSYPLSSWIVSDVTMWLKKLTAYSYWGRVVGLLCFLFRMTAISIYFTTFFKLRKMNYIWLSVQLNSLPQSFLTLCDPMNCSTPGLPVHHQFPEFTQIHVHRRWCHPAISSWVVPFSSCPQSLLASESFPMSQLFPWGGQSTGVSALASFLPKNTQDWSPLGWTGWISLQSKGLSVRWLIRWLAITKCSRSKWSRFCCRQAVSGVL